MGAHGLAAFNKTPGCAEFRAIPASEHGATILAGRALWNDLFEGRPDTFDSVACDSSQSASITFTSGTTGAPKGAEHTHGSEYFIALAVRHEHDMKPGEIVLAPVPLFSSYRFSVLHTTCLTRSTLVILPRFDPVETWRAIQREKVEVMYAVSTMLHRMRDAIEAAGVNLEAIARHWRLCVSGSTPLLPDVHRFFNQALGVKIHVPYGATEVMLATILSEPVPLEACSIGKPVEHVLVRIVDDAMKEVPQGGIGEIVVRSAMRMKGYFNDPETTRHSFSGDWFHTGDLGYEDAEGTFHLAGRIKEMINRNGFKVYPLHVEKVLSAHPAVALAAVVGIPDVSVGEEVKAYVVLKPGAACSKEELTAWTKERVAAYAYPRIVEFRDSLPLARYGTVVKHLLRASSPGAVAETPAPEN